MAYCRYCGAEVSTQFCTSCGKPADISEDSLSTREKVLQPQSREEFRKLLKRQRITLLAALVIVLIAAILLTRMIDQEQQQSAIAQVKSADSHTLAKVRAADAKTLSTQAAKYQATIGDLEQRLGETTSERDVARSSAASAKQEANAYFGASLYLASQVDACQAALKDVVNAMQAHDNQEYDSETTFLQDAESQLDTCVGKDNSGN